MPEVIERKVARDLGCRKYFTGKVCRNGHVAERYTQSGTCVDCLAETNSARTVPIADFPLVELRLRATQADGALLIKTAIAVTQVRFPTVSPVLVCRRPEGSDPQGGMWLYVLRVDPQDVKVLTDMQFALMRKHAPDIEAARQHAFGLAAASYDSGEWERDIR